MRKGIPKRRVAGIEIPATRTGIRRCVCVLRTGIRRCVCHEDRDPQVCVCVFPCVCVCVGGGGVNLQRGVVHELLQRVAQLVNLLVYDCSSSGADKTQQRDQGRETRVARCLPGERIGLPMSVG